MPRIAIVEKERCNPVSCGGYLCIRVCPINREGAECIGKADDGKAKIDEKLCIGCDICVKKCPFDAISIINLPEQLDTPLHRFGRNGFHLYNLPIPVFGKVVGILGRNGIGKSTALKVLAGLLKPNLGKSTEASWEEVIQFFKGSEAQRFLEKVKAGEIKISYKPQQVDLIPKNSSGKVIDLLKQVDEKNKLDEIAERLELTKILENDVRQISGGELQRVAIAATVLKEANLYIFDEPTSFLDIKQRIKVSKFIRELATEDTAVLVVEHDLIILDFMTDLTHVMYGKEACYGIVSNPYPTKTGINNYLEGYLKDSNMRFRDHAIKFQPAAPIKFADAPTIVKWSPIHAELGNFKLQSPEGELKQARVVGILGENGIGKTTFVKILAGVTKPDSGKVDHQVTVSYKPQYIETDSEEMVAQVIPEAISKYDMQLIKPLQLKHLFEKRVCDLSGGELQRVSIAKCLSQEAEIFLMDEPSAYLDAEQRLHVSKIIGDMMELKNASALIVDHDLLFLDYLSQELLVFQGIPAREGNVAGPFTMEDGMNNFLTELDITMRREKGSFRPRINKPGSVLDREQKSAGKLYYS